MRLLELFHEITLHPKNAKELKGLILLLAVKGKLTANWRAQNTILNRELLKFEISIDDEPFDIPKSWNWSLLGKHCSVQTGRKDANHGSEDGAYNFYTCAQLPIKSKTFSFEGESILLPGNGANVGQVTYVNEKFEAYQRTYVVNGFQNLYPLYVKVALEALWKDNLGEQYGSAINYIKIGNITEFKFPIPPLEEQKAIVAIVESLFQEIEKLEQLTKARIELGEDFVTAALRELTAGDTPQAWSALQPHFQGFFKTEQSIKKLRESILQLAVQGKLTANWRAANPGVEPASELLKRIQAEKAQLIKEKKIKKEDPLPPIKEDEKPFELPDGWAWCRLGSTTNVVAGASFNSGDFNQVGGVKCIKITNAGVKVFVETSDYLPEGFDRKYPSFLIKEGDLILALTRPYITDGLKISVCPASYNNSLLNQRVAAIKTLSDNIQLPYVFTYLQSPKVLNYYKSMFDGKSQQPNMKMKDVLELPLSVPPMEEQRVIVQKVNQLMAFCDDLEEQIKQNQTYAEQLMQSVVREVVEG